MPKNEDGYLDHRETLDDTGEPTFEGGDFDCLNEGIAVLEGLGFNVTYDPSNREWEGITLTQTRKPEEIKGISYPDAFQCERPLDMKSLPEISAEFISQHSGGYISDQTLKLWYPLIGASTRPGSSKLANLAAKVAAVLKDEKNLGIAPHPERELERPPRAFVPARHWFSEEIQNLEVSDIITFLPPVELELFTLWVGRLCVGKSGSIPLGYGGQEFNHYARLACILYGGAGIGKSTSLFTAPWSLSESLKVCGYKTATYQNLTGQFGLSSLVKSDLGFKDDLNDQEFLKILMSDFAKSLVTGGRVKTDEKYMAAQEQEARPAFVACANQFQPHWVSKVDPGSMARFQILKTYDTKDLLRDGVDYRPSAHIPRVAEYQECDPRALMLWVCRLAIEKFENVVAAGDLERTHKSLVASLDVRLPYSLLESMIPLTLLMAAHTGVDMEEIRDSMEKEAHLGLFATGNLPDTIPPRLLQVLKEDWVKNPELSHPYRAASQIEMRSWNKARASLQGNQATSNNELDAVTESLKAVYTVDGYSFVGNTRTAISTVNTLLRNWDSYLDDWFELSSKAKELELQDQRDRKAQRQKNRETTNV